MLYGHLSIAPEIMSGIPVFAGTRVPLQNLFDYMEGGDDVKLMADDGGNLFVTVDRNLSYRQNL